MTPAKRDATTTDEHAERLLNADIDRLYGLPLSEFTPARAELARRLRADGDREAAATVARLRKPTLAAWAVNRVVRDHPREAGELIEAGRALRRVPERQAIERARAAVTALVRAAGDLRPDGKPISAAVLGRIEETLHAAVADEGVAVELERGRVVREQRPPPLGGLSGGAPAPVEPPRQKPRRRPARDSAAAERKREQAARRSELRDARSRRRAAERDLGAAERAAAGARRRVAAAEEALETAEAALGRRRDELEQATTRVEEAERRLAEL